MVFDDALDSILALVMPNELELACKKVILYLTLSVCNLLRTFLPPDGKPLVMKYLKKDVALSLILKLYQK